MTLQSSLRLQEVDMLGPNNDLVRKYSFAYGLGPTSGRTLLTSMSECGADGVCKPPTTFGYTSSAAGFLRTTTPVLAPTSKLASPMLLDVDGDGLSDLVVPDTSPSLSTPGNPITNWKVARNQGATSSFFGAASVALVEDWTMVANPAGPSDPTQIQPELGTAIDYNADGLTDVLLHDVTDTSPTFTVLLAQADRTFKRFDTGIPKPFPLAGIPTPPNLASAHASVHLADVDGDGVPDLVICNDHSTSSTGNPSQATWTVQLWKAASGGTSAGFEVTSEAIGDQNDGPMAGYPCNGEIYTLDVNGDGKVDLLISGMSNPSSLPGATYLAVTRHADATWDSFDTGLPLVPASGKLLFLDLNGDGLPDALESGQEDGALRTWLNTGPTFSEFGKSLQGTGVVVGVGTGGSGATATVVDQGSFLGLGVPLDFNGDGLQDVLVPLPAGIVPNESDVTPAWAVLQSDGLGTFTVIDPHIPFEVALATTGVGPAHPNAIRAGDVNGDGAQDVLLLINGVFNTLLNAAGDQDLLTTITDGMNAHAGDTTVLPNVTLGYGHLNDTSITMNVAAGDPSLESLPYLSHADPKNACDYPRSCVIGPRRVVTSYVTNNGADLPRHFSVGYRDGRYHRLGRGFLGFGERVVVDLETEAGVASYYDNVTEEDLASVPNFPYAFQAQREERWSPGLATQPNPSQFEVTLIDLVPTFVPTNGDVTYMTLLGSRRVRKAEGSFPGRRATTAQEYVASIAAGSGATVLLDATVSVSMYDPFGFPVIEDITTSGIDLTLHVTRTFTNDTTNWVLGQLQTQNEYSSAAGLPTQCRTLVRHTTQYGEVHDDTVDSDEGIPDTNLSVTYDRDAYGNPKTATATDLFGHKRVSSVTYDSEGIYPKTVTNSLKQTTQTTFDPNFGVLVSMTDPNGLVTKRAYDSLGRLGLETRPDGSQTTITLARTKKGGPQKNAWLVTRETATTGGADDTVELDSLSREVRWFWHGPTIAGSSAPRIMQEIAYDALGEHVARRSVPNSEGTPEAQLLNDTFQYDALGREVVHKTPWGATLGTAYSGFQVTATDALSNATVTVYDPLSRPVNVTDATKAVTSYVYGPFGALYTATAPGSALTRTTRDAYGRVRQLDDPNRGTTKYVNDGFGEPISSVDALSRSITYSYDALGRLLSRLDQNGSEMLSTSWTWDTAAHGIGKLATLVSPDGSKSYAYNPLSQLQTVTLDINGESDALVGSLAYDNLGRVKQITYPTPSGVAPFVIDQDRDAYGHVLTVRDDTTSTHYWNLTAVDGAGRFKSEAFGNGVVSTRTYFADKQRLQTITTTHGSTALQSLSYGYDARLDLSSGADALQSLNTTERFRYDPVERLKCAYFNPTQDDSAPCALSYSYDPSGNGNLVTKSDVGSLLYADGAHPHAVTSAGTDSFGYDLVGNQTARPAATIAYTPFDLPKTVTQALPNMPPGVVTFAYDGDENRIRKSTPTEDTLYFGDLYERDTVVGAPAAHRYHVHSPERVVAIVTVGGTAPGALYVHVDHLGSVDVLTDASGKLVERRSYDPFGARRNPVWGQPPPGSFSSLTTVGYTGQEADNELGLVNLKGRIYDPKTARFLTTDPIVGDPLSSQSWNAYSYVANNPLNLVDPTGLDPVDPGYWIHPNVPVDPAYLKDPEVQRILKSFDPITITPGGASQEVTRVTTTAQPVDVGVTGSASGNVAQPVASVSPSWSENPWVQLYGGFFAGIGLGAVPFAGLGHEFLDRANVLDHGTVEARRGLAVGQIVGGVIALVGGITGAVGSGALSITGVGAAVGVPAMAISAGVVVGGLANIGFGIRALMSTGGTASSPAKPPDAAPDAAEGPGIIYLRRGGGRADYVGQAKPGRFAARQAEHAADHPGAEFEYHVLEEVHPGSDRSLNVAEEDWIRAGGGPQRFGGSLSNERYQMSDKAYTAAGGLLKKPTP